MTINSGGVIVGSKRPSTDYSNCPLKKRPIKYDLDAEFTESDSAIDSSSDTENNHKNDSIHLLKTDLGLDLEPQNLSTKPEDLRLTRQLEQVSTSHLTGLNSLLSVIKWESSRQNQLRSTVQHLPIPLSPSLKIYPADVKPLEPLCLNTTDALTSWAQFLPAAFSSNKSLHHETPESEMTYQQNQQQCSHFTSTQHHSSGIQPSIASLLHLQQNSRLNLTHRSRSLSSGSGSCSGSDRSSPIPDCFSSLSPCSSNSATEVSAVLPVTNGRSIRYQCPDCTKSYSTFSGLTKHLQFHCSNQSEKSFSCKYCEKVYTSLGALKMHIRTHTLPCKCTICGKAFSRPWLLQGHIRTHTGEKPFSCEYCHRAFADRSNLRAHLQTHSEVKKYSCQLCFKTFSRTSLLTKHQESGCKN